MTGTTSIAGMLGPLAKVLDEADVVEISVNADQTVWVERFGHDPAPWGVMEPGRTDRFIRWCATWSRASILAGQPIFSGRIPGTSHRIEALVPPAVEAPVFSIRRHRDRIIPLEDFLNTDPSAGCDPVAAGEPAGGAGCDQNAGTDRSAGRDPVAAQRPAGDAGSPASAGTDVEASPAIALAILDAAIAQRRNILIAGATGCGKTTLLNSCLDHLARIAPRTRLVAIEDTPEIRVSLDNALFLRTCETVSMDRLLVSTLRLAPDRIVVGEVREGKVLMTLIKAWNTGHPGGLSTLHANSAAEVLPRLSMLATEVMEGDPLPALMESLDTIVFLRRGRHRPVVETIVAMRANADGTRTLETVYET